MWAGPAISDAAKGQISALLAEKTGRTHAQKKMDSQLVYAVKQNRNEAISAAVPTLPVKVDTDAQNRVLLDIKATVSQGLLDFIVQSGGAVVSQAAKYNAIRATMPHGSVEALADRADVRFVRPALKAFLNTSEGDVAHTADLARTQYATYGATGSGVKIGVLSDGVNSHATLVSNGVLSPVTILAGQAGSGDEGTAMLAIVHDLAPGATLYFATGAGGVADMAQNILNLAAAGCAIIVDDISYPDESPFQDGVIAQAVTTVSGQGVMYFSAAGNSGRIDAVDANASAPQGQSMSGTWEGDFADGGSGSSITGKPTDGSRLHNFSLTPAVTSTLASSNTVYNALDTTLSDSRVDLFWTDPLDASSNDYDLFVLSANGTVLQSSTNIQDGSEDPYEHIDVLDLTLNPNAKVVIVKAGVAAQRFLHLSTGRNAIAIGTNGSTRGHNASGAANAFCVAATDVSNTNGATFTGGTANPVEPYSSDGPRRVFFTPGGGLIMNDGNFSSTGGTVLNKPDFTAADDVQTAVPLSNGATKNPYNPFRGTSAAAPHAAAIAALLMSYNHLLTPAQVRQLLTSTALPIGDNLATDGITLNTNPHDSGAGIVMAKQAMLAAATDSTGLMVADALGIQFTGLNYTGVVGGMPVSSPSAEFTIINNDANSSDAAITWTASVTQPWITLSGTISGSEGPGVTDTGATLSFTASANTLPQGTYTDTVTFYVTNNETSQSYTRTFPLILKVGEASVEQTLFDSYQSAGAGTTKYTYSGGTPRQFLGDAIHFGTNTSPTVTGGTAYMVATTATVYTNIRLNITFWGNASNANGTSPNTAAFTNQLYVLNLDLGALNTAAQTMYTFPFVLPSTVTLSNNTGGITINWQGDTGNGLVSTDNLTPLIRYGPALNAGTFTAGTAGTNGWYQGKALEINGNFTGADFTAFTGDLNQGLALQLFGVSTLPTAVTSAATNVTSTAATLNGTMNPCGAVSTAQFQYGLDTDYGLTANVVLAPNNGTTTQTISANLSGLSPGTTYHFRLVGTNVYGETDGPDLTFTTSPTLAANAVSNVSSTSVTLNGTVSSYHGATTVIFNYGPTTGYGSAIAATQSPITGSNVFVSRQITGLLPATLYHYNIVATNVGGSTSTPDATFMTFNNVATLSGLSASAGTLSPNFSPIQTGYTMTVANAVATTSITPTVTVGSNATVQIKGNNVATGTASGAIPLDFGANALQIKVIAQDGITTEIYTLTVIRAGVLSNLKITGATLSPGFTIGTLNYTANALNTATTVSITPTSSSLPVTITFGSARVLMGD